MYFDSVDVVSVVDIYIYVDVGARKKKGIKMYEDV